MDASLSYRTQILRLLFDGWSISEVMEKLNLPFSGIERVIRMSTITKPDGKYVEVFNQFRLGCSFKAIGDDLGIDANRIRRIVKLQFAFNMGIRRLSAVYFDLELQSLLDHYRGETDSFVRIEESNETFMWSDTRVRNKKISDLYASGWSLRKIGESFGITGERVRQIIESQFVRGVGSWGRKLACDSLRKQSRSIRDNRKAASLNKQLEGAKSRGIKPELFQSLAAFCRATGIQQRLLKDLRPDLFELLKHRPGKHWSRHYSACRNCNTTSKKHRSLGLCNACYVKSEHFKSIQRRSHQRKRSLTEAM